MIISSLDHSSIDGLLSQYFIKLLSHSDLYTIFLGLPLYLFLFLGVNLPEYAIYIFINTILSKVQSPDYSIYYSYKILQQEYMSGFQRKYGDILKSINVIVGTQIDRTKETQKTIKLAERIKLAINNNETEFIFGLEGKIIYFLYRISPLLSDGLIYMKRYLFNNK